MNIVRTKQIQCVKLVLTVALSLSVSVPAFAESALKDEQIATLRAMSQSLLAARQARKDAQMATTQVDRQHLQSLNQTVDALGAQANKVLYQAKRETKVQGSSVTSIQVAPATRVDSVQFDPETRTFSPISRQGQNQALVTANSVQSKATPATPSGGASQQPAPSQQVLQTSIAQARAKIAQVRQSVRSRMPKAREQGWLARIAESVGLSSPAPSAPVPASTASVLQLTSEMDQALGALPADVDPQTLLNKTRTLKKRLTLSTPARPRKPVEPTFTTRTKHR